MRVPVVVPGAKVRRRVAGVFRATGGAVWRAGTGGIILAIVVLSLSAGSGRAQHRPSETLADALVQTYKVNPVLNAERARLRGTDEAVPQALSGYRPQVLASMTAGLQAVRVLMTDNTIQTATLRTWVIGLTVAQTLFDGFKTANTVRQSESQVLAGREALRNTGQGVLLDAVTAYMNVLANQSLVDAQRINVAFLRETLNTTRKRLDAGDVTPTDVAQAEARLSRGLADLNATEVALAVSQALYAQVIGSPPGRLLPPPPIDRLLPRARDHAIAAARREHPAILAAMYDTDSAQLGTRIAESSLMPQVSVQAGISRSRNDDTTLGSLGTDNASVLGQAIVPLYDGGLAASQIRQSKELVTLARIVLQQVRDQTQTAVLAAWVTFEGAKIALNATEAEVRAATIALSGVQKEAQGGQRTTLDVLNSQQDLMAGRARLIGAQRDRVIASYALLSAIGRLDVQTLGLPTPVYAPEVHYHQVRDAWGGLRTPAGQ